MRTHFKTDASTDHNALLAEIDGKALCPNCGEGVATRQRSLIKIFCGPKCRAAFHRRNASRGQVLAPLMIAQTLTRHARPGSADAEVCTFARQQITEIAREFADQDEEAGRPPASTYIDAIRRTGTVYADRRR